MNKVAPVVLAIFVIGGCSAKPNFNSTVDAITRYKDLQTREAQLEARKEFDEARRKDAPGIISDYYFAVDRAVRMGEDVDIRTADICEAEVKLDKSAKPGECRRLTEEWVKRIQDWKPDK